MKDKTAVILIIIGIVAIVGLLIFIYKSEKPVPVYTYEECVAQGNLVDEVNRTERCTTKQGKVFLKLEEFCGSSTEGLCDSDSDCVTDGCSGQVCRSVKEEAVVTTCEWQECYDNNKFNVRCGCTEGKCEWN